MPVSWLTQPSIDCALPELLLPWSLCDEDCDAGALVSEQSTVELLLAR